MNLYTELRQTPKQKAKGITAVSSIVRIPLASYSRADINAHNVEHEAQTGFWNTTIRYDILANEDLDELVAQYPDKVTFGKSTKDLHWFITMTPMNIVTSGKTVSIIYSALAQSSARVLKAEVRVDFHGSLTIGFDE